MNLPEMQRITPNHKPLRNGQERCSPILSRPSVADVCSALGRRSNRLRANGRSLPPSFGGGFACDGARRRLLLEHTANAGLADTRAACHGAKLRAATLC